MKINQVFRKFSLQQKLYESIKYNSIMVLSELSSKRQDLELLNKIIYYDPQFQPNMLSTKALVNSNVPVLKDWEFENSFNNYTNLKIIKKLSDEDSLHEEKVTLACRKSNSDKIRQLVMHQVKNMLLDEIDENDKYKAKVLGLLEKTHLSKPSPEVKALCDLYESYFDESEEWALYNDKLENSTTKKEYSENVNKVANYLTCVDYFIKGLYIHKCIDTKPHISGEVWSTSHQIISRLDLKIPILIGDLFNFKALQVSSKLDAGFNKLTEIEELFSKITFNKTTIVKQSYESMFLRIFYNTALNGLCDLMLCLDDTSTMRKHTKKFVHNDSDNDKTYTKMVVIHPKNSILSYNLTSE